MIIKKNKSNKNMAIMSEESMIGISMNTVVIL